MFSRQNYISSKQFMFHVFVDKNIRPTIFLCIVYHSNQTSSYKYCFVLALWLLLELDLVLDLLPDLCLVDVKPALIFLP